MRAGKYLCLRAYLPGRANAGHQFGITGFAADTIEKIDIFLCIRLNAQTGCDGESVVEDKAVLTVKRDAIGMRILVAGQCAVARIFIREGRDRLV